MIPWRLQFSGIRDYGPTEMNMDTANEHVLITGPNGAGKSTISFCMGAVLRSSKVDVGGLKSQNLPEDETWKASVRFLFKNEGPSRIDGPLYIEFRLLCEQQPKQPIKLQYEIHDGDALDELELWQIYRSGDVNKNNFTAYKRELEFKYKVHPDLYYLIWYQQEVNQFAVMAPEERFRIFSEMHGITKIQKDWEISLEAVKDARESFATATSQQKAYEFDLSVARSKKDRYEDNRRRLTESGFQYAQTTHALQVQAEQNCKELERFIEDRTIELEDLADEKRGQEAALQAARDERVKIEQQKNDKQMELDSLTEQITEKDKAALEVEAEATELATELSDLTEAYQKLPFSEEETKKKWEYAVDQAAHYQKKEQEHLEKVNVTNDLIEKNRQAQSDLKAKIQQWKERSIEENKIIDRYTSSFKLKNRVKEQQLLVQSLQNKRDENQKELDLHEEELDMLQRNQIESPRQQEAIKQLKKQGINAYAFRHFIQLQDNVTIEQEHLFDAIKYTIFYDATTCRPTNDLYHVSLKNIIPDRSLTALPKWGLQMRDGLNSNEQNQAARVLWWIEQFFTEQSPYMKDNYLIDRQGMRGSQEQSTYILSKKALEEQKKKLKRRIIVLNQQKRDIEEELRTENEKLQIWNSDIRKVEEAEAFFTTKAEQDYRINQLAALEKEFQQAQEDKENDEQIIRTYWEKAYEQNDEANKRAEDLLIYKQFGEQSTKINHLHELEHALKNMKQEISTMKNSVNRINDQIDEYVLDLRKNGSSIIEQEDKISQTIRQIGQIVTQKSDKESERVARAREAEAYKVELADLKHLIPEIVEEALVASKLEASKYEIQNKQNQAKVEFNNARTEKDIDPHAVENYNTLEAEVARKKDELLAAKNLLEENEERAIQNEKRLETAIAMQVQKINLLFEQYMGLFQFEGRVVYEKLIDKKERPIFKLFIHVRKEGHRGKLEDVSIKARGGRVGKGVSGGEESLSSLLFALSLLQNLENKASFIVMDEFDSALDETRKAKVFELYAKELQRKLIILSPKGHEDEYYNRFSKAFIVSHNPIELKSTVKGLVMKKEPVFE